MRHPVRGTPTVLTNMQDYLGLGYLAAQVNHRHVSSAWIRPRISSYQRIPGLRKPCSKGLESGFAWITRGENMEICSTVKTSSKEHHVRGAAKKSMSCCKTGKSAPSRERSDRG